MLVNKHHKRLKDGEEEKTISYNLKDGIISKTEEKWITKMNIF